MSDHPQPPFELQSQRLGALPIIDLFLRRAGVERVLARYLLPGDRRIALPGAVAIGVLVRKPVLGARAALRPCRVGRAL